MDAEKFTFTCIAAWQFELCLSENVLCMLRPVCHSVEDRAVLIGEATCQALEGTFSSYFDTLTSLSHGWR